MYTTLQHTLVTRREYYLINKNMRAWHVKLRFGLAEKDSGPSIAIEKLVKLPEWFRWLSVCWTKYVMLPIITQVIFISTYYKANAAERLSGVTCYTLFFEVIDK